MITMLNNNKLNNNQSDKQSFPEWSAWADLRQGLGVLKLPKIFKTSWLGAWVAP